MLSRNRASLGGYATSPPLSSTKSTCRASSKVTLCAGELVDPGVAELLVSPSEGTASEPYR